MYTINSSVLEKSGFDAAQLEEVCRDKFAGLGQAFLDAETLTGINALYMISHGAIESAWGTSDIAVTKNNLFGWNANDSDPAGDASEFSSYAACIEQWSAWLKSSYLTAGGSHYNGDTIHDIFVDYSSSHDTEANSVVSIMNELLVALGGEPEPATPVQPPAPSVPVGYVVQAGDTFDGSILPKYPGTTIGDWLSENEGKYPTISANFLEAGWDLLIPEPSQNSSEATYLVQPGDNLIKIASKFDTTTGQLVAWNQTKYPRIGSGVDDLVEAGWDLRVK